ncbi:MAG TPA: SAM-dependent methyltransferase [Bryobacteraceae bacterium]
MPAGETNSEDRYPFLLESERRLSESLVWQAQRDYFHRAGVEAWRTDTVPHYITNNPALARAYAAAVFGFLRDCQPLDAGQPLHIIELGAGSGRFGFLFLRALLDLIDRSGFLRGSIRYVLSDFTESNLDFWRSHEALEAWFEEGILDLALIDAACDKPIRLERSGETLTPGTLRNPVVVLANYFFDSIPQDAFTVKEGELSECLISLFSDEAERNGQAADLLEHLASSYSNRPVSAEYYPEREFNEILRESARTLSDTTFLFPCAGLRTIRRLADLAGGRLFLLTADRGEVDRAVLEGREQPSMLFHGSFSIEVDYHVIGEYFVKSGGQALRLSHPHSRLAIWGGLLGQHPAGFNETRLAFHQAFEQMGPDDFYTLRLGVQKNYDSLDLAHLLSLVRLSGYDPRILGDCLPAVETQLERASAEVKRETARIVRCVWANYYHIGELRDLAFEFGALAYGAGDYQVSAELFRESLRLYGEDPRTRWNLGLCHAAANRPEEAADCFRKALTDGSGFVPSGALQAKTEPLS